MTDSTNKLVILFGSLLLMAAISGGAVLSAPALFFIPIGLLFIILLIQYPQTLFYLLLFAIPWSGEAQFTESLGTDLPDELLMLVTSLAALLLFAYHQKKSRKIHLLLVVLLCQAIWIIICAGFSTDVTLSVKYFLAKCWYLLAFVAAPLLLIDDKKKLAIAAAVLTGSMFLVTALAIMRHAQYGFTFTAVNEAVHPFFRNHVTYSALLVFMLPLQLCFWRMASGKRLRQFIFFTISISLVALFLSYARGAWLALLLAFFSSWLLKRKLLFKSFCIAILLTIAAFFYLGNNDRYLAFANDYRSTIFHQNFEEHLAATYQGKDLSTAERFYRWVAGVRMAGDSWTTGFGPNTFYENYKSYTQPAFKTWVSHNDEHSTVHNYFLLQLIEQGIIGLLLFMLLIGAMFWKAEKIYHRSATAFWKHTSAAVAAILVMICTVNFLSDLIETDKVGSVFYLCIAVLVMADKSKMTDDK